MCKIFDIDGQKDLSISRNPPKILLEDIKQGNF